MSYVLLHEHKTKSSFCINVSNLRIENRTVAKVKLNSYVSLHVHSSLPGDMVFSKTWSSWAAASLFMVPVVTTILAEKWGQREHKRKCRKSQIRDSPAEWVRLEGRLRVSGPSLEGVTGASVGSSKPAFTRANFFSKRRKFGHVCLPKWKNIEWNQGCRIY